jgi:hypothetical protein
MPWVDDPSGLTCPQCGSTLEIQRTDKTLFSGAVSHRFVMSSARCRNGHATPPYADLWDAQKPGCA